MDIYGKIYPHETHSEKWEMHVLGQIHMQEEPMWEKITPTIQTSIQHNPMTIHRECKNPR